MLNILGLKYGIIVEIINGRFLGKAYPWEKTAQVNGNHSSASLTPKQNLKTPHVGWMGAGVGGEWGVVVRGWGVSIMYWCWTEEKLAVQTKLVPTSYRKLCEHCGK